MVQQTNQMSAWSGSFGKDYTDRNHLTLAEMENLWKQNFGLTRTELNERFLGDFNKSIRILEVGCNIGNQLLCLQQMGFTNLYGIELQQYAVEMAKSRTTNINIITGSAFDVPYKDNFFDLVFTSGVLIHIHPDDVITALEEIHRCSRKYIWGAEYCSEQYTEVRYHNHDDLLWKTNFSNLYRNTFDNLELIKEQELPYLENENIDLMFLLKKR